MGGFALSKIRPGRRSLLTLTRSRTPPNDKAKKANDDSVKTPADGSCSSGITEVVKNKTFPPVSDNAKAPTPPADDDAIDSCSSTEASSVVTYESSNDDSTLSSIHSTSLTSFAQNLSPPQIEFQTKDDETLTQATPSASIICRGVLKKNRSNGSPASSEQSPKSQSSYQSGSVIEHLNALYKIRKDESEDSSSKNKNEGSRTTDEVGPVEGPLKVETRSGRRKAGRGDGKRDNVRGERRGLYEM